MKLFITILLSASALSSFGSNKTICGNTDDRVLSSDAMVGRLSSTTQKIGCTATLISKTCAVTAGHCSSAFGKLSFNVPLSRDTQPQSSNYRDIYYVDASFKRLQDEGEGKDWAVIKLKRNNITGLYAGEAQGFYKVRLTEPVKRGMKVRVTGFGSDKNDDEKNFAQQTHSGIIKKIGGFMYPKSRLGYDVDTMGGNSGSSVILEDTDEIIGVHAHGSCGTWADYNEGTLISNHSEFQKAISDCLATEEN